MAEKPFQKSGVRHLWTFERLELTLVVNKCFQFRHCFDGTPENLID